MVKIPEINQKYDFQEAKKKLHSEFNFLADYLYNTVQKLNLDTQAKILDIGTGLGVMAIILSLHNFNVLTGEPKPEELEDYYKEFELEPEKSHHSNHHSHIHAGKNAESYPNWQEAARLVGVSKQITFQYLNVKHLPFQKEKFDAIFLFDTFQYLKPEDRESALKECLRVIESTGLICIVEYNQQANEIFTQKYGFKIEPLSIDNFLDLFIPTLTPVIQVISGKLANAFIVRKLIMNS